MKLKKLYMENLKVGRNIVFVSFLVMLMSSCRLPAPDVIFVPDSSCRLPAPDVIFVPDKSEVDLLTSTTKGIKPLYFVKILVNDHEGLFVIDVGASNTCITNSFSNKIGLEGDPLSANVNGAKAQISLVTIDTFKIGDAEFSDLYAVKSDLSHIIKGMKFQFDGILGCDILSTFAFDLDFLRKKMTIYDHSIIKDGMNGEDMLVERRRYYIPCTYNGHTAKFLIDTGANLTHITATDAKRCSLPIVAKGKSKKLTYKGERKYNTSKSATIDSFTCAQHEVKNVRVRIGEKNILGLNVLSNYILQFDPFTERMQLIAYE